MPPSTPMTSGHGYRAGWSRPLRALTAVLIGATMAQGTYACAAQVGRFSPLSKVTATTNSAIGNAGYLMNIEKGIFKVSSLTPQFSTIPDGNNYGTPIYAGGISLRGPSGHWLYENPGTGYTYTVSQSQNGFNLGTVTMNLSEPSWAGSLVAKVAAGYPQTWYTYTRTSGTGAIHGGLVGYDWAGRVAPTSLSAGTAASQTAYTRSGTLTLTPGGAPYYLAYQDTAGGGFSGCLRFDVAPTTITIDNISVQWDYATSVSTTNVQYMTVAPTLSMASAVWISGLFPTAPTALTETFGNDGSGNPQVTVSATGMSNLMLPAGTGTPNGSISTVEGTLGIKTGASSYSYTLPTPPQMATLNQTFPALNATDQGSVDTWINEVIANQASSGTYNMSGGRGFYDGVTCSSLALVYPNLSTTMKASVKASVKKCLDYLWTNLPTCTNWPAYKVAPEQAPFVQGAIDYPEIMGFILQATALYCKNIDSTYLATRWSAINTQFNQYKDFTDWSGAQYANPGPDFYQIIPEGSIGGYLGWHALYHLATMNGQTTLANEARARAAMAYAAFGSLYAWKTAYGSGIVNGNHNGPLEIFITSIWAYQQYAWFTFLPGFALPDPDTYHVWSGLENMPGTGGKNWMQYTQPTGSGGFGSSQRAYDGANMSAYSRVGKYFYFSSYREDLRTRSVRYSNPDGTPAADNSSILMIPAEYWTQLASPH